MLSCKEELAGSKDFFEDNFGLNGENNIDLAEREIDVRLTIKFFAELNCFLSQINHPVFLDRCFLGKFKLP